MANQPSYQLAVGGTFQLHPVFLDQNGRALQPQPAASSNSFASSDATKATVSASGLVTAVAAGAVVITCTSGSLSCTKNITVYAPVAAKIVM